MSTRVVFDGALFSECEQMGTNRSGMLRLTEDITNHLVKSDDIDIFFANTIYTQEFHELLKSFVARNYPAQAGNIISRKPLLFSEIPKLKGLLNLYRAKYSPEVSISGLSRYDIFHSFYYPFPGFIEKVPIRKSITYLDIIPLRMQGYSADMVNSTKKVVESIVPNFAISISEFSKQDLIDYDKRINPDKVFVAHLAASKALFFENKDQDDWKRVKAKYSLPDNYFLSISSNDQRKNVRHLITCFSDYCLQQNPHDLHLVLTGNFMFSKAILDELNVPAEVRKRIVMTDRFVDNEDLASIYSNAMAFFFMSHYEGFGLPVLEAMQCGTPVVTSNKSSIPEIVHDSGIMLEPDDADALKQTMNVIYTDGALRKRLSEEGLKRAEYFSWERCAREYAEIFKKIATDF